MTNKQKCRIRRTLAYAADPKRFTLVLVCAILGKTINHPGGMIAVRLNGTSDIQWENVDFNVSQELATFCRRKYGVDLPLGTRNIFELFNYIGNHGGPVVSFYDYTKIRRNWAECKRLGYDLTFSFDGWDNAANLKLCREALLNGVNVAAAFNIKRGQQLPGEVNAAPFNLPSSATFTGGVLPVLDGDVSDYRPADPQAGVIIGLRFKLPHGVKYTAAERDLFCIA